jgi:CBS domain-containing protein
MKVSDIMTHDVKIASPEDTLQYAARMMDGIDTGAVPVGENDRLVGIVSLGDLALKKTDSAGKALKKVSEPEH